MSALSFIDLIEYAVVTITTKIPHWFKIEECEVITEERVSFEIGLTELVTLNYSAYFQTHYLNTVRRKFHLNEWLLTLERISSDNDERKGSILVGALPRGHFIFMAPFVVPKKEAE